MSRVSPKTFNKVAESVLAFLNEKYPAPLSCTEIADEIARDNEFVARVLAFLKEKNLVRQVLKNSNGKDYLRWTKWTLSPSTRAKFEALE